MIPHLGRIILEIWNSLKTKGYCQIGQRLRAFSTPVFKSLFHKAKVVINIGVVEDHSDHPQGSAAPHDDLFMIPK